MNTTPEAPAGRSPFADVPPADYVRDAVAAILIFVSFSLPWDATHRGADRIEVVLLALVSLASLGLPYLARSGVLPATWTVHTTRRARLLANAPYVVLVAVYALVDLVQGKDGLGIGTAAALGLAGAALAAQPRACELGPVDQDARATTVSTRILLGLGVAAAATTALGVVLDAIDGPGAAGVLWAVVCAALVVVLATVPAVLAARGDEAWRTTLVGLGIVLVVAFVLGSGQLAFVSVTSVGTVGFGLLLVPAAAALAASAAVERATRQVDVVDRWAGVAERTLLLLSATGVAVAANGLLGLVDGTEATPVADVLGLVVGIVVGGGAFAARRTQHADLVRGRNLSLVLSGLAVVLGTVLMIVAGPGQALAGTFRFLLAFGLPALVAVALTAPRELRELTAGGAGSAARSAYQWQASPSTDEVADAGADATHAPDLGGVEDAPEERDAAESTPEPAARPVRARRVAGHRASSERDATDRGATDRAVTEVGEAVRPATGRTDRAASDRAAGGTGPQVVTIEGERTGYAARPGLVHDDTATAAVEAVGPATGGADSTQVMAAAMGRWTPADAADPATPLDVLATITAEQPELRPYVAANPSTYPALLDWLAQLGDPEVDRALRSR
ncbi:hypothetical protein CLV28_1421 [Sediminihabitans luteus]|uniref:Uncharacterized protein n=1 Tax=Sediminihabitans luteus TaxID=1138585 RepID=A0A2M9CPV0_9CELL|nr:hypothetical protein [Sediminihabitans luteus]PJJ73937.1 hypothetical protein CLV28_1421 [Sediminihabitans luteus]GII98150.1 hypothetical protein Slu03_05280 [Sediminihabitans luteus]